MIFDTYEILFYSVMNVASLYIVYEVYNIVLEKNSNNKNIVKYVTFLIYFFMGFLTFILNKIPSINVLFNICITLIMSINFKGKFRHKVIIAFLMVSFFIAVEFVVTIIAINFFDFGLSNIVLNSKVVIIVNTINLIISLIICSLLKLVVRRVNKFERVTYIDSMQISIIPLCSVAIFLYIGNGLLERANLNSVAMAIVILVVVINITFYYIFDRAKEAEKLKYENAILKSQWTYYIEVEENINNSFEKIRTLKHDLKYQLLYLKGQAEENTIESIEEMNRRLDFLIGEVLSEDTIEYSKNKGLNRLLNYKLLEAKNKNIEVDINVDVGENTYIDENSLYIILGNAIDNAIRNFDSYKSSEKNIKIKIIDDGGNIFIKITNPYNKKLSFKKGLPITDKEDKNFHGVGISSIKHIVEEKNGYFKIETKSNIFALEILLFENENS
ncbi:MAG: GHKL domain-containing protein [Lachnospirales bacterium]